MIIIHLKFATRQFEPGVIKYKLSALFRNLCDSCISVRALLLLLCVHTLGLGLDLGNSLDWRERTHAYTQIAELPKIKRRLIPVLNDTHSSHVLEKTKPSLVNAIWMTF